MKLFKLLFIGGLVVTMYGAWRLVIEPASYNIHELDSYTGVIPILERVTKDTLVLFDIDNTILTSPDMFAHGGLSPWWFRIRLAMNLYNVHVFDWHTVYALLWCQAPRELCEPQIPSLIAMLKARGCTVLALTGMETGACGDIANMPAWRYEMLKRFGVEFSQHYPNHVFTQFEKHRDGYPVLYRGILCTNRISKGKLLLAFLDQYSVKPSNILCFDDEKRYLRSVAAACELRHIPYQLFWYQGAHAFDGVWDVQRATAQVRTLLGRGKLCKE